MGSGLGLASRLRALCLGLAATLAPGATAAEEIPVDLELVIAVDVSRSMDFFEAELQRQGYARAIQHSQFLRAVTESGLHGRIAVTYIEWAGTHYQKTVADWVMVDGQESAAELAELIQLAPFTHEFRTSIGHAIAYSMALFEDNGFAGLRQVIDISGDGANNQGVPVDEAREAAIAAGITINGLPIMTGRSNPYGWLTIDNLDEYYADCVIGGPGAFLVPVRERSQFIEAIRRKLLLEIAGLTPEPESLVIPIQARPTVDCLIGERQWERYMRRWSDP